MKKLILILVVFFMCPTLRAQWRTASATDLVLAFGVHDTTLFASFHTTFTDNIVMRYVPTAKPFDKWVQSDTGIDYSQGRITSFVSLGPYFFAGQTFKDGTNGGEYRSNNNGLYWNAPLVNSPMGSNGTYLFTSSDGTGYRSRDTAVQWSAVNCPGNAIFAGAGSYMLASTPKGLWRSTDSGGNWSQVTNFNSHIRQFALMGSVVFAVNSTSDTLLRSKDSGSNWTSILLQRPVIRVLAATNKLIFAGTDSGIYFSRDSGSTWTLDANGLGKLYDVTALCVFDTFLFANTLSLSHYQTWYRPLAEFEESLAVIPIEPPRTSVAIYPNPAHDWIAIESDDEIRSVTVLNLMGEEVHRSSAVGNNLVLDLSALPSGMYWCRVQTQNTEHIEKLVLER